jgi:hypothetical protein
MHQISISNIADLHRFHHRPHFIGVQLRQKGVQPAHGERRWKIKFSITFIRERKRVRFEVKSSFRNPLLLEVLNGGLDLKLT